MADPIDQLYFDARTLAQSAVPGDLDRAVRMADEGVERFPEEADLWYLRGDMRSLRYLESVTSGLVTHNPDADADTALASYQRAIEIDPDHAEAWAEIGYFYDVHHSDYAQSIAAFRRSLEIEPSAQVYARMAIVTAESGDFDGAEALLHPDRCLYAQDDEFIREAKEDVANERRFAEGRGK